MTAAALILFLLTAGALTAAGAAATNQFVVAAYNIENWVLMERDGQPDQPKPDAEQQSVADVLAAVRPAVLGLEEIGTTNQLAELTALLAARGLDYPYSEWIQGWDYTRHVALLSRFPITSRHSRTDYDYRIATNVLYHSRGVLDVAIRVTADYSFRAVVAHLKSRRKHDLFDHVVMRQEEARLLRAHVDRALQADPDLNLIVMGDFNEEPGSEPVRTILGQPPSALLDLVPRDRTGQPGTYLWRYRGLWSRVDYLCVSPGMTNEYVAGSARVADEPGWDKASDHRAVYASFLPVETVAVAGAGSARAAGTGPSRRLVILGLVAAVIALDVVVVLRILARRRPPAPR